MEALLGYEMVQVACGASHVLALSTERELFAWGRGDGGKLSSLFQPLAQSHNTPAMIYSLHTHLPPIPYFLLPFFFFFFLIPFFFHSQIFIAHLL